MDDAALSAAGRRKSPSEPRTTAATTTTTTRPVSLLPESVSSPAVHHQPAGTQPNREIIGLTHFRPGPRPQNEYVDSPQSQVSTKLPAWTTTGKHAREGQQPARAHPGLATGRRPAGAVTAQPVANPALKKANPPGIEEDGGAAHGDSVICNKCGKCKCGACREPRELPSWWFCGKKCEISARAAVNVCSCLCCVKGIFYHYAKDYQQDSDVMCSDDPCAGCDRPHCFKRWACMALLAVCLPCLCFYWPAKGAVKGCTACYNGCSSRGCQCSKKLGTSSQTRRLLIESDSSSA